MFDRWKIYPRTFHLVLITNRGDYFHVPFRCSKITLFSVVLAPFVVFSICRVLQPVFLGRLLRYYNTKEVDTFHAYLYATGIILCSAVNVFVIHPYMMAILHMGMKIRVACCSLIYRKALKLTRTALGETTIGQAVNLLSNDVSRFDVAIIFLHFLWIGPLETVVLTYFMYREVEISSIIGVAILLLFIPLQGQHKRYE